MPAQLKKLNTYNKPFWTFILSPKRIAFLAISAFIFTGFLAIKLQTSVFATTGINRTINFQGKVVNRDGTNVADGQYTFVFKLWDASSGGSNPWTETQNNVQVTAGIFRVSLGSVTTFASAGVDFNTDNLYLGINFNSDGEMTPRVRFAAVPYAINAETVAGLTVTNTTGTLTIPNSKTVQFGGAFTTSAQDLTLTLSGSTNVTLPTSGTLATLGGTENLSNKTFTSTITISGVTTDITTGTNEALTITPNGTGNVLINPSAGGQAALIVDKNGLGDVFSASVSGTTKFVITTGGSLQLAAGAGIDAYSSGALSLGNGSNTSSLTIGRATAGITLPGFDCSGSGNGGKLTTTSGGVLTCSADGGGAAGDNFWQYNASTGIVANGNLTTDLLLGSTATASAKFSVLGIAAGTNPTASVSATSGSNNGNGIVIAGNGTIQSLRNNTLTLGGNTSGELILKSRNAVVFKNPGSGNTILGEGAGSIIAIGSSNTFIGNNAGLNSDADSNTFIGDSAGRTNGAGTTNTFVGRNAGYANNGGSANAFFGFEAGRYTNAGNNTFIGQRAGYSNNSGANNVFLGFEAGESPVGANANTSGQNNVFIGYQSGPGSTTQLTNAGAIGYQALVNASNALVLGGTGANALNVGIGTTTPVSVLQVVGGNMGGNAAFILNQTGVSTNDLFAASASGTTKFVIKNDGTASTSAGFTIDAAGSLQTTKAQTLTIGNGGTGNIIIDTASGNSINIGATSNSITVGHTTTATTNISGGNINLNGNTNVASGNSFTVVAGQTSFTNAAAGGLDTMVVNNHTSGGNVVVFKNAGTAVFTIANGGATTATNNLTLSGAITGGKASLIVNQNSANFDILAASSSGTTKFVIKNDGTASSSAGFTVDANGGNIQSTNYQSLTIGGGSTGELTIGRTSQKVWLPGFDCSAQGNGGKLTTTTGGVLTCSADGGGAAGDNFWQYSASTGIVANGNLTTDLLIGGTSTQSAMFSVLGIAAGTNPSASVSAQSGANANKGIYMSGDGSLQAVRNNTLTLGGSTTGDISLSPLNGLGNVRISSVLTQGARSVPAFSISQANDASNNSNTYLVDVTNSDSGSTTALVNLSQVASGVSLQIAGTIGNTGRGIFFPSGVSGNGAFGMLIDNTVTNNGLGVGITQITSGGTGFYIEDIDNITTGKGINLTGIAVDPTAFSGDMIVVNPQRFLSTGSVTDTGNYLDISRAYTANGGSWTIGAAADLVTLSSNCTVSSGSCVDASSILSLTQSYGVATGAVLDITSTGLGSMINVSGASGGKAAVVINQTSSIQDIFAASASGTTKFVIKNDGTASTSGNLVINAAGSLQTTDFNTLNIGGSTTGNIVVQAGNAAQALTLPRSGTAYFGNSQPYNPLFYKLALTSTGSTDVGFALNPPTGRNSYIDFNEGSAITGLNVFQVYYNGTPSSPSKQLLIKASGGSGGNLENTSMVFTQAGWVGLGTTSVQSQFHINGIYTEGNAALIVDQRGNSANDILAASSSGITKFRITNDGTASTSAGFTIDGNGGIVQSTRNQSLTIGGGTTGELTIGRTSQKVWLPGFDCSGSGNGGKLTTTTGGVLTCSADGGGAAGDNFWQYSASTGIVANGNLTTDLLIGGTSTQSAMFSVLGIAAGTNPSASVSAQSGANANKGIYMSGDGSLQSVRNNFLTLGGNTTGDIYLKPLNGAGMVRIVHGNTGTGGLILGDSETDGVQKSARIKSVPYSNATSLPISMLIAVNSATGNVLNIGGGSATEYAATDVYIKTAANQTTTVGTTRFYVGGASGFVGIGDANASPVARLDILDEAADINGQKLALRRTGAGDVGISFQQNGISAFGIVNRSGIGSGLAFVDNYWEGNNGTEIARFYASSGVGIGTLGNTPVATLDVRGVFTNSGTQPVATLSATTSAPILSIMQSGFGDLITASTSGTTASLSGITKFNVNSRGTVAAADFVGHDVVLGTSSASIVSALKGYEGYTNFTGGIGTGGTGVDSQGFAQRLTSSGNLVNIGSIQAGETYLTAGGTFGAATNYTVGTTPRQTAVGDVNGDGYSDLVVANSGSNTVSVLFNNGSGSFVAKVDYSTGTFPTSVALGDLNGDGRLDIATANASGASASVLINNGGGTFAPKTDYLVGSSPQSVAIGDLNGDGKADLATANNTSTNVSVLINNGNGTFANKTDYATGSLPTVVAIGDLNGDGFADLAVSNNGSTSVSVFLNNGNGTFAAKSDLTVGTNPRSVAIADVNGDYKADIIAANNTDGTVSVLINNGGGAFATQATYSTGANPQGVAVGDVNGDGKADIATADNSITAVSVLTNSGSGTFPTSVNYTVGNSPYAVTIADLNADGKQDMVVTNNGAGTNVSVLLNQTITMFFAQASTGRVGIGTTTPKAALEIAGGNNGGNAALIVNQNGATTNDIFSASASGNTKFVIKNDGTASTSAGFTIDAAGSLQTTKGQTLTIGGNSTGDISFKPGNSSTSLYLASNGAIGVNGSFGALGQCLLSNGAGATASWGGCAAGTSGGWFNLISSQGTIVPVNQTLDLLWGGNSTSSAGFRIIGATSNYGTGPVASIAANTSFAGMVFDQRGTGDILTASVAGATKFIIHNSGNVTIGSTEDSGFRLDVKGSVRIGNNTTTDDVVKDSSIDFTQSGYAITTNDSVNTVTTSEGQLKLVTDLIGAGASLTAPAADQTTGANVTTGSVAFQRPDKKFIVFVGGAATSKMYDPTTGTWTAGPNSANGVSLGAGARAFQRQNGSFLVMHGGAATTTTIYSPGGSANFGSAIAGPATTAAVGAGSQIIRRPDGKILVIHGNTSTTSSVHDPVTATGTTSLIGTFITGPATTGNVVAGSFAFQRPDGKWILGLGGGTTTNLYDPSSSGVGGGGAFSAGPSLSAGAPAAGTHVIQLPDGRFMVLVGGSTATQIYDWKSNSFSAGSTMTVTIGAGAHSFQRSDGKWVVVAGGNSTSLMLYDPTSGANGTFSNLGSGLSAAAGAGALTIQRPDGKYVVVHGNAVQTTTLYDAGWNTTGTWTSEDILNTKISTYSAMIWSANPQSANNNARLDAETINVAVKTGDTLTSLGNNPYRSLQDSGDLIRAYGNSQYAKVQITFTTPIRSYPGGTTAYVSQSNIWEGEGGTFLRRSFIQPTVFSFRIQNPLVSYGDPSGQGDPAFGRNFATASAMLEGVITDNSNRLSLSPLRNLPTATASAGFIIASASANLGGAAGAGAHTIERNNGQFITILGNSLTTTRVYDSDTNTWSAGPDLPNTAGAGAHSFLMPDGRFFVVLGGTTNKTAIFDPQANLFQAGPNLFGNVGIGANTFQRPDGFFVILNGGATAATNILDPFTMSVTQGPFTVGATTIGGGSLNIRRPDGRILIINGNNSLLTNIYDPASNTFAAGPALLTANVNTGGNAIQISTGRVIIFKSTATSNYLDPIQNTFTAGPTPLANAAGSFIIPRSDGKILKATGATNTTSIIDPAVNTTVTGTSAPTLPCTVNTGAHVFQRPTGEYVLICGSTGSGNQTAIIDAGWNLGGTYTTEQIQVPNLSGTSSLFWKNSGQGSITVKYRTASSQQALGVASWKDAPNSGAYLSPASGDTWLQVRFDLQGALQDLPGAKTRVWNGSDAGGGMVYYRSLQTPILQYWKLMNIQDPTLLTLTSGGSDIFRFASDGQAYTSDGGAWNSGGADLAERYQSQDSLAAGEVVSLDRFHPQNTRRSTTVYDQNAMGVVSTQPGFVAGAYTENSYPIALVGRVPVKVSTENGEIHAGDYLTSASIPGYAMKATVAGRVIGQAMEDFTHDQVHDCPKFGAGNLTATKCGTITVFVNLTSYNGESVEVAMKDSGFALKEEELPVISGMDFAPGTEARRQQEVLGFLKTQKNNGQSVYTDRVAATQEVISPQIVTDLLVAKKIKAESIEGLEIITNSIESLSSQLATGSAVVSFSDRLNLLALNQKDFETQMSSLSAKLDKMSSLNILSFIAQGSTSGELTMVNNFASYGTTTLSEASVMNTITIGSGSTLNLSNNSLYTLGDDLSIQPFRQGGVNFLGGLIRFDTDGKATFGEDVTFAKNVGVAGVLSAKTVSSTELQLGQGTTTVISDTEVTATAAAGLVTLKRNTDHVKVNNPLVRDNSFIFITPKTKTVQQLFLLDQIEGTSFTVGVDGKSTEDIKFNYLIVN